MSVTLTAPERHALEAVTTPAYTGCISRTHLEKLLRLDLVEPGESGMCMTLKGKTVLFGGQ
jgi:hypothetical protein